MVWPRDARGARGRGGGERYGVLYFYNNNGSRALNESEPSCRVRSIYEYLVRNPRRKEGDGVCVLMFIPTAMNRPLVTLVVGKRV